MLNNKIIIIAGPTAVGKTAVSIKLAKRIGTEIISADSMQVYRGMDIGTAKITQKEMEGVKHHLIDVLSPFEDFNITIFKDMAENAVKNIHSAGKIPIITGGTGFYIQSLIYGINFEKKASGSDDLRNKLDREYDLYGADYMHKKLAALDPESSCLIHKNNKKRIIRALEYVMLTGEKISEHNRIQKENKPLYDFKYFVLNMDRNTLYKRIDIRVDKMISDGFVDEVRTLKEKGLTSNYISMHGIGYRQLLDYLDGKYSFSEAIDLIKKDTRHFAKRQLTWFKHEKDVIWIDVLRYSDNKEALIDHIMEYIDF